MPVYQGTFATIKATVIAKLKLDATQDETEVEKAINLAYLEAVQETGGLQLDGTATTTAGIASYFLPPEVAWLKLLVFQYADGTVSDPLQRVTLEQILEQRRATVAAGQQVVRPLYAIVGQNQLEIWPTPNASVLTLQFWYVYLPDELTGDDDEPALMEPYGSKLLEYGALVELGRLKKDPLLADYEAGYQEWLTRFQRWLNRREGASPITFRVGRRELVRVADRSTDYGWGWGW